MEQILPGIIIGVAVAVVSALVSHFLTKARERERWKREDEEQAKQRRAELEGLLRFVSVEIALHKALVLDDILHADPKDYAHASYRSLKTDAWEQVRPRLAQLLPPHRFANLAEYYVNAQQFNDLLDEHTPPKTRMQRLPYSAGSLANDLGPEVRTWMREDYIGPMNTLP
jgi:hypothetical protein